VNEGILKADISLLEKQNSKPVTGGYKKGDETTISSEPGCTYYIYSITKYGSSGSIGMVTLSKSAPVVLPEMHDGRIKEYENKSILIGDYDFYVRKVFDNGKDIAANIKVTKNTALIEDLELKKGDYIWMGENLYQIENIAAAFRDKVKDPNGNYEWNPGYITFKVVQEYLPNR
ncbi:MAG: hypothetical protein ABI543_00345, partial [Ignavibacteria bacterium]